MKEKIQTIAMGFALSALIIALLSLAVALSKM